MSWAELFSNEPICWFPQLQGQQSQSLNTRTISNEAEKYDAWLGRCFPDIATSPLSPRHIRLWEWFESLEPLKRVDPAVEIWPRGGAKSSTVQLCCARLAERLTRRFVLYVSGKQDQADNHVQSIADLLETQGVERAIGKYGNSKGWRRNQLRTSEGFNVAALGLDVAARGIKLGKYRPDLIIFDDIDDREDTAKTVEKKERRVTQSIIPAGSIDCAVLFVQNLIHEDGIVAKLADGRADFLYSRRVGPVEPAVRDLAYEKQLQEDGSTRIKITGGEPTWSGQSLSVCEFQINDWGERAFLREAQQKVFGAEGWFFDAEAFITVDIDEVPTLLKVCRAWDLAATEGGGDWTVGVLIGISPNGVIWILDVIRKQYSSEKVEALLLETAESDFAKWGDKLRLRFPLDPGQAGKWQEAAIVKLLKKYRPRVVSVTGKKAVRAEHIAKKINSGNSRLIRAPWNADFKSEYRKFKEDESHEFDDQVDAGADSVLEIDPPGAKPREMEIW